MPICLLFKNTQNTSLNMETRDQNNTQDTRREKTPKQKDINYIIEFIWKNSANTNAPVVLHT